MFDDQLFDLNAGALAAAVPADLRSAIQTHGLAKVASALTGTDLTHERAVYEKIGRDLFARRAENAVIARGLRALSALER